MPLHIISGDIFSFLNKVDAIVVPANKKPVVGHGLDSQLFKAAGFRSVMEQRKAMGYLHLGQAKETNGFKAAKYLIHTATPMWLGGASEECEKLKSCYINSIKCADRLGLKSIAIPLLSSGNMKFPMGIALETAKDAINERLSVHDSLDVYLVKFHGDDMSEYYRAENAYSLRDMSDKELLQKKSDLSEITDPDREVVQYMSSIIRQIEIKAQKQAQEKNFEKELAGYLAENPDKKAVDFRRERFYDYFETCGIKASRLAEMIGCDRSTVSRIKNGQTQNPQKKTIIALAIAMGLDTQKRLDFINCSGYSYPIDKLDYTVEQLISDGFSRISDISDMLYDIDHSWLLIGSSADELSESSDLIR